MRWYSIRVVIRLSPEIEALVERDVASGRYANADEYVAQAVELLEEREAWREETLDEQRAGLEAGRREAERGELTSLEDVRLEIESMKVEWKARRARFQAIHADPVI